nr:hypothetical protein [Rhodanobacter glycinis]
MLALDMSLWMEFTFWEQEGVDTSETCGFDFGEQMRAAGYATKPLGCFYHDRSRLSADNLNRFLGINH